MGDASDISEDASCPSDEELFAGWLAGLIDRAGNGETIDFEAVAAEHPERAGELGWIVPMIAGLADPSLDRDPTPTDDSSRLRRSVRLPRFGDFRIVREIGRGGMAVVYEAAQVSLDRRVALKVLPEVAAIDPRRLLRFQLEAHALACLDHPHIVPVYAVGSEEGLHFLAMRLIRGPSAAQVIRDRQEIRDSIGAVADGGPSGAKTMRIAGTGDEAPVGLPPTIPSPDQPTPDIGPSGARPRFDPGPDVREYHRWVARLGRDAAGALDHAHRQGILHRDVKPSNLLVDEDGTIWVADFGLARVGDSSDITLTGETPGTLRYMSPEQWLSDPDAIDHRIDVYGLGATLYELLALRPVNPRIGADSRPDQAGRSPVPLRALDRKVPRDLETIVLKAISGRREDRYATAKAMSDDLGRFLEGLPILARRPSLVDHARKWTWRHRGWVSAGSAVMALAVTLFVLQLLSANALLKESTAKAERHARESESSRRRSDRVLLAAQMAHAQEALRGGQTYLAQDDLDAVLPEDADRDRQGFAWSYLSRLARRTLVPLRGHRATVLSMALSPDGRTLATADRSGTIRLWDPSTHRPIGVLESHRFPVSPMKFASGSGLLISGANGTSADGGHAELFLWDVHKGRKLASIDVPEGNILTDVELLAPEGRLITKMDPGDLHKTVATILDISPDPSRPRLVRSFEDNIAWLSPDARTLLLGTIKAESIAVADTASGEYRWDTPGGLIREPGKPPPGPFHQNLSYPWVAFSGDGLLVAIVDQGKRIVIRSADTGVPLDSLSLGPPVHRVALSRDGNAVALAEEGRTARVWDRVARTVREFTFTDLRDLGDAPMQMIISPDGARLAIASRGDPRGSEFVATWETATGRKVATWPALPGLNPPGRMLFGSDGRSLWLCGDGPIVHWTPEADRGDGLTVLKAHAGESRSVDFAPDDQTFVTGGDDARETRTIKVWDARTHRLLRGWCGHPAAVTSLSISPDGKQLASGSLSRTDSLRIWDLATGRLIAEPVGLKGKVRTVAFHPDGSKLAAAGDSEEAASIVIWDTATWTVSAKLVGHDESQVHHLTFSRDGLLLASAGEDRTVRVWDLGSKKAARLFSREHPLLFRRLLARRDDARRRRSDGDDPAMEPRRRQAIRRDLLRRQATQLSRILARRPHPRRRGIFGRRPPPRPRNRPRPARSPGTIPGGQRPLHERRPLPRRDAPQRRSPTLAIDLLGQFPGRRSTARDLSGRTRRSATPMDRHEGLLRRPPPARPGRLRRGDARRRGRVDRADPPAPRPAPQVGAARRRHRRGRPPGARRYPGGAPRRPRRGPGHLLMRSIARAGAIRPASPRTAWWAASWSDAGRRRSIRNGGWKTSSSDGSGGRLAGGLGAATTRPAVRQRIVRHLIEQVKVQVDKSSERVAVELSRVGGLIELQTVPRPVSRYDMQADYPRLVERRQAWSAEGRSAEARAAALDAEGFRPPKRAARFTREMVRRLSFNLNLARREPHGSLAGLGADEYRPGGLARHLGISRDTVRGWIGLGRVTTRRAAEGHHIVRADASELARLGGLHGLRQSWESREHFAELIQPKVRPER